MGYLRAKLRKWLVPEVDDFSAITEKAKFSIHEQACAEIGVIKEMQRIAGDRIDEQLGALFIKFPGQKQVAVKDALKLLLAKLELQLYVQEMANSEKIPRIRRIGGKKVSESDGK